MKALPLLAAVLLLTACAKDKEIPAHYLVNCAKCSFEYTDAEGNTRTQLVTTEGWKMEMRLRPGQTMRFRVCPQVGSYYGSAFLFFDGGPWTSATASCTIDEGCDEWQGVVPETR